MLSTDQMQRAVSLLAPARRIVSLVPSQTELLCAIGAKDRLVGLTKFCTEPKGQLKDVAKVGGTKQFDFAAIEALQPDLIIGNKEENYPEGIERLAESYPVWMSDILTLEDALDMIVSLGMLSDCLVPAESLVTEIREGFDQLALASLKPKKVAYLIWQKPYMVAGGDTFINTLLKLGALDNVFAEQSRYPEVSMDAIASSEAELVLLSSEPFPFREKHLAAFSRALPNKAVKLVDAMPFSWYGSQLLRTPDYLLELHSTS